MQYEIENLNSLVVIKDILFVISKVFKKKFSDQMFSSENFTNIYDKEHQFDNISDRSR